MCKKDYDDDRAKQYGPLDRSAIESCRKVLHSMAEMEGDIGQYGSNAGRSWKVWQQCRDILDSMAAIKRDFAQHGSNGERFKTAVVSCWMSVT